VTFPTQAQIQDAAGGADYLIQIADWDGDGAVDAAAIAKGQAGAGMLVHHHLRLRYVDILLDPVTILGSQHAADELNHIAADEAVYVIKRTRGATTDADVKAHEERVELLKALQSGMNRPANPAPAKSDAVRSEAVVNNRDVSRTNLNGLT
jgi:phage gp36-like protein